MEIVTLQRRLVEVGRIRLGQKKVSKTGKSYPARLDKFRLTSRDKQRLDAAALLYGGKVTAWEGQWELFTETDALPVAVVPGQALNQSFELWGQKPLPGGKKTGVICLRRCDGETEFLAGSGCLCAAADEQLCKPTTRLSVVLTEVPGIGVWRVEAHGWNAASELAGGVQLLEALVATGRPVRARLRLDAREQVTETETRNFVVPVLDIDHTLGQVLDSIGPGGRVALAEAPAPELEPAPRFTPVPAALEAPKVTIAEQVATPVAVSKPRKNAATPVPATGRRPRTAAQANNGEAEQPAIVTRARAVKGVDPIGEERCEAIKARFRELEEEQRSAFNAAMRERNIVIAADLASGIADDAEKVLVAVEAQQKDIWDQRRRHAFAALTPLGLDDDARHQFIRDATDGATESTSKLTEEQLRLVVDAAGGEAA